MIRFFYHGPGLPGWIWARDVQQAQMTRRVIETLWNPHILFR